VVITLPIVGSAGLPRGWSPRLRASATIRDENGTNIAPLSAKKYGHNQLLEPTVVQVHADQTAAFFDCDFDLPLPNVVFIYVSFPIRRTSVSAGRIFFRQTCLM
jgi:hypothetical protein